MCARYTRLPMSYRPFVEQCLACLADPARRERYFDLYSEDVVLHGYQGVEPGLASVKQFYAGIWSAFPDASVEVLDWLEQGDKVALRFVLKATHAGPFLGIPGTGKPVLLPGMTFLRFAGGKCVERWSAADFLAVLGQIGAFPPGA